MEKLKITIRLDRKEGENPYQFMKMGVEIPEVPDGPVKDLLVEKAILKRLRLKIEKETN